MNTMYTAIENQIRVDEGGLRQSERKLEWLSDYSYGGDLRG